MLSEHLISSCGAVQHVFTLSSCIAPSATTRLALSIMNYVPSKGSLSESLTENDGHTRSLVLGCTGVLIELLSSAATSANVGRSSEPPAQHARARN